VDGDVVEITKIPVLDQLPERKDERKQREARQPQRHQKPSLARGPHTGFHVTRSMHSPTLSGQEPSSRTAGQYESEVLGYDVMFVTHGCDAARRSSKGLDLGASPYKFCKKESQKQNTLPTTRTRCDFERARIVSLQEFVDGWKAGELCWISS
jgi:hypothetical protein